MICRTRAIWLLLMASRHAAMTAVLALGACGCARKKRKEREGEAGRGEEMVSRRVGGKDREREEEQEGGRERESARKRERKGKRKERVGRGGERRRELVDADIAPRSPILALYTKP